MNELALFAGAGGGLLGGKLLGWRSICAVEQDPYAISVLLSRQNDRTFKPFPIWDDVKTFDGSVWKGRVDLVSGGFPCQDISSAGRGEGLDGERSGLWREMLRIVREVEPAYVFIENSPLLRTRGLQTVLEDLTTSGYICAWGCFSAKEEGAHHKRNRMWILAYSTSIGQQRQGQLVNTCDSSSDSKRKASNAVNVCESREWPLEPAVGRVVDGMAHRSHRLKAIGNGQVPRVAARAFIELKKVIDQIINKA